MKVILHTIVIITLCSYLCSCSSTKVITSPTKKDEIIIKPVLKDYMKENPSPRIVIRVDEQAGSILKKQGSSTELEALEKEFTRANFQVKDRALFKQVLEKHLKESKTIDYASLQSQLGTDIIFEITDIKPINYKTNKYKVGNGAIKIWKGGVFEIGGIELTCRMVLVKTNDIAGICTFNYSHCPNGCEIETNKDGTYREVNSTKGKKQKHQIIDGIEEGNDALWEEFTRSVAQKLVKELKG